MTNTVTIKEKFFNSLQRGTGEAYLIARTYKARKAIAFRYI